MKFLLSEILVAMAAFGFVDASAGELEIILLDSVVGR
jgi:hypothetical protein